MYILNNSVLDCEAYFEGGTSDNRIVTGSIRLSLRKYPGRTTTTVHNDWYLINNRRTLFRTKKNSK